MPSCAACSAARATSTIRRVWKATKCARSSNPSGRLNPPSFPPLASGNPSPGPRVLSDATFESTFRTYYASLCGFAFRYLQSAAEAEDIVHDVFAALWSSRRDVRVQSSLRAYLFASVRNRALNARKHAKVESDWAQDESADSVRELHPHPVQPDELLDRAEVEARLAAAMDALPERCAMIMRLRWREQLSYAEIAETMGISVKGVEKQLERGLKSLRSTLGE